MPPDVSPLYYQQADLRESEVEKIIWDDLFKSMRRESTVDTDDQTRDSLLKVKHRLFKSFKKGQTFGHKFRIVSDYKDVLKHQIELDKKELVEKDKDSKK